MLQLFYTQRPFKLMLLALFLMLVIGPAPSVHSAVDGLTPLTVYEGPPPPCNPDLPPEEGGCKPLSIGGD